MRAVWILWDWLAGLAGLLNVAALARGFRDVLGAEPITFYQWPEPPPDPAGGWETTGGVSSWLLVSDRVDVQSCFGTVGGRGHQTAWCAVQE